MYSSEAVRDGEASSPPRRWHRPRGDGRGEKAHRFHERARLRPFRDRRRSGPCGGKRKVATDGVGGRRRGRLSPRARATAPKPTPAPTATTTRKTPARRK